MNHHYPDNYHGYGHNAQGMPSMGYTGGYADPAAMARMVHPREGYQMSHYQMMQQQGGMYTQGRFVGQQTGNPYSMGGYGSYSMPGMSQSVVMGNRQGDISRMAGGSMVNPYYSPGMPPEAHSSPHHGAMGSQPSTYSHSQQANPHMQQPHLGMMSSQGHHSMPPQPSMTGQPLHGQQGGKITHNSGHSLPQVGPPQSSGAYGGQGSPHMVPRAHHVPQHPMRHPTTQQNPQEVADTILQMASAYPSNQTVQVPLKSRPAPYHIPRSPHYSMSHTDHPHTSPNPHMQPSPAASCQASPSPSSSSVKSPTPVLAPIPNPIPSPGISGLRSPCNQGMSPCGTQRSPAHMGSTYSGHSQGGPPTQCGSDGLTLHHCMSPSDAQHYSPCGLQPAHTFSPFGLSAATQRTSSMYSPSCDPSSTPHQDLHQSSYSSPVSSSPCSSNLSSYPGTQKHMGQSSSSHHIVSSLHMGNNPLMSLQKLVMLPETQVVDPKSVVNDTCLSSHQDESSKNVNGPAERFVESSNHSVGFQGHSSSHRSHHQGSSHTFQLQNTYMADAASSSPFCASNNAYSPEQKHSPCTFDSNNRHLGEPPRQVLHNNDDRHLGEPPRHILHSNDDRHMGEPPRHILHSNDDRHLGEPPRQVLHSNDDRHLGEPPRHILHNNDDRHLGEPPRQVLHSNDDRHLGEPPRQVLHSNDDRHLGEPPRQTLHSNDDRHLGEPPRQVLHRNDDRHLGEPPKQVLHSNDDRHLGEPPRHILHNNDDRHLGEHPRQVLHNNDDRHLGEPPRQPLHSNDDRHLGEPPRHILHNNDDRHLGEPPRQVLHSNDDRHLGEPPRQVLHNNDDRHLGEPPRHILHSNDDRHLGEPPRHILHSNDDRHLGEPPRQVLHNNDDRHLGEPPRQALHNNDDSSRYSNHELCSQSDDGDKPILHSSSDKSHVKTETIASVESSEHKLDEPSPSHNVSATHNNAKDSVVACLEESTVASCDSEKNDIKPITSSSFLVDGDGTIDIKSLIGDKIEKLQDIGTQPLVSLERKNGRVKEDSKCLIVQCHSPNVLLEMPVVSNGLPSTECGNDDGLEQDCGNGVHTRIQNAFNSLVKAKFASVKKGSPFACVTPCSIAVGADERAACERFAFRRNGFCRTLRTSRIICNGRSRNDSTGNGDSDESLENMSENSFGLSESPQDGNRKRPSSAAKRNDHKKPNLNSVSATSKVTESDSKPAEPVASSGNGCASHGNDIASDDDTCYYEGVDSSDIFINNCSSDESVTSSAEVKQSNSTGAAEATNEKQDSLLLTCTSSDIQQEDPDEKSDKTEPESPSASFDKNQTVCIPVSSTPPSKRLRRSSGQKAEEKVKAFPTSRKFISNIKDTAEPVIDLTNDSLEDDTMFSHNKTDAVMSESPMKHLREQNKSCSKFRPLILGHKPGKYPVVILEKPPASVTPNSAIKQERGDSAEALESSSQLRGDSTNTAVSLTNVAVDVPDKLEAQLKLENIDLDVAFHIQASDGLIKMDPEIEMKDTTLTSPAAATPIRHKSRVRKKRPPRRKVIKNKDKRPEKVSRDTELRDSFKSMKFSRTLDLMKSRRRREQPSSGPFIRVVGKQNAPDAVTVFTQPVHDSSLGLNSGKHKHFKSRHGYPLSTATTTIHMMTNLPADKAAMVSSSRTISHDPWVCAFCAHHSSYRFLGDLYGPYFKEIDIPRVESIAAEESKKGELVKDQKASDSSLVKRPKEPFPLERKSRRSGRSPLQCKDSEPNSPPPEEVWVHEACVMWSLGVYLVGNKLYGLDEAVRDAAETVCSACKSKGAMIGCLNKGCSMKYHFVCAIDKDCYMDEENLSLLCPKHKGKRLKSAAESTRS